MRKNLLAEQWCFLRKRLNSLFPSNMNGNLFFVFDVIFLILSQYQVVAVDCVLQL